jgi:hypothetical protein
MIPIIKSVTCPNCSLWLSNSILTLLFCNHSWLGFNYLKESLQNWLLNQLKVVWFTRLNYKLEVGLRSLVQTLGDISNEFEYWLSHTRMCGLVHVKWANMKPCKAWLDLVWIFFIRVMLTSSLRPLFKEFIKGNFILKIQVKHLSKYTILHSKVTSFDSLKFKQCPKGTC